MEIYIAVAIGNNLALKKLKYLQEQNKANTKLLKVLLGTVKALVICKSIL